MNKIETLAKFEFIEAVLGIVDDKHFSIEVDATIKDTVHVVLKKL